MKSPLGKQIEVQPVRLEITLWTQTMSFIAPLIDAKISKTLSLKRC